MSLSPNDSRSLFEQVLLTGRAYGMETAMFGQHYADSRTWTTRFVHPGPWGGYPELSAVLESVEILVWGPDSTASLVSTVDPDPEVDDPRCLLFSWCAPTGAVPGFDEFSFDVNYWWRQELEAEDFEHWMNHRLQRATGSMWESWLENIDMDAFDFLDDPMSSAEYAAFNTWYQAHGIFEWRRLVAEMNRSPGADALMVLELFDADEFPNELITPYVKAGVPSAENALVLHRDGVPLELVSAMFTA